MTSIPQDYTLFLEDKLKKEWSSLTPANGLTNDLINHATKNLENLDPDVKTRLTLSLLRIPQSELANFWESLCNFLDAAAKDSEPWTRAMVDLVSARLNVSGEKKKSVATGQISKALKEICARLLEELETANLKTIKDITTDNNSKENNKTDKKQNDEIDKKNTNGQPPKKKAKVFVVPPDFFPMEWPYLCPHLLGNDFDMEHYHGNVHFTPVDMEEPVVNPGDLGRPVGNVNRQKMVAAAVSATTARLKGAQLKVSKKSIDAYAKSRVAGHKGSAMQRGSAMKIVSVEEMEKEMKAKEQNNVSVKRRLKEISNETPGIQRRPPQYIPPQDSGYPSSSPAASPALGSPLNSPEGTPWSPGVGSPGVGSPMPMSPGGTPASGATLLDGANKMTPEDKATIEAFLKGASNPDPSKGDKRTMLHSQKKFYANQRTIIVVQSIYVRIDYETRKFSKVKKQKKYSAPKAKAK